MDQNQLYVLNDMLAICAEKVQNETANDCSTPHIKKMNEALLAIHKAKSCLLDVYRDYEDDA